MTQLEIEANPHHSWCVKDVAAYWGVSEGKVYDLINSGLLTAVCIGRCLRVKGYAIEAFEKRHQKVSPAKLST